MPWTRRIRPDARAIASLLGEGPASRGVWDTLLWVVLVLVLVEPWVANRLGSKKVTSDG